MVGAIPVETGKVVSLSLRRDGRRLLFAKFDTDADTLSIWQHDLDRHVSQLVRHDEENYVSYAAPAFSPDGDSFIYMSTESGNWAIHEYWPETRDDKTLGPGNVQQYPSAEIIVGGANQWFTLRRADGSRGGLPLPDGALQPRLSPDARSVAFSWTGTGQSGTAYDIYVQSLPSGAPVRLSSNGGFDPEWSRDGRELFYLTPNGYMMAAQIDPRNVTVPGQQVQLFAIRMPSHEPLQPGVVGPSHYAPSADGRFVMIPFVRDQKVTVVSNWRELPDSSSDSAK